MGVTILARPLPLGVMVLACPGSLPRRLPSRACQPFGQHLPDLPPAACQSYHVRPPPPQRPLMYPRGLRGLCCQGLGCECEEGRTCQCKEFRRAAWALCLFLSDGSHDLIRLKV